MTTRLRWDRGTLIVQPRSDIDPSELPGVLWDPRIGGWRAPAYRYRDLGGSGLVDETERPSASPALRPYQEQAVRAWAAAGRRGVVVLPTGAGKTRTAVAAIARTGLSALCIAPTRVLVGQWCKALSDGKLGPIGQLGDGKRHIERVTVATTASARAHAERLGRRFALLVVDEVHHHAGTDETLELYLAPARLGLTATPPEEPAALDRLAALVGPIVYRQSVEALAGTFLSTFDLVRVPLELPDDEASAYHRDMARFRAIYAAWARTAPGAEWAAFAAAASRSAEGRQGLAAWRRARERLAYPACKRRAVGELLHTHQRSKALVFARDNATAYAIARDHLVAPLTCDIGRAEREAVLQDFAAGRLRAICSARVLNEGLDVPDADVAILTGGSQGSREYVQRVGRVLRPAEGKRAVVYELVVRGTHEERQVQRGRERLAAR